MKKLTIMTIVLLMLLAFTTVVSAATVEAKVGEEITLEFDLGETAVRTGRYTITYPAEYLEYVAGTATPCNAENADTAGEVVVAFAGANTTKITLKFNVIKEIEAGKELNVTMTPDKFVGVDGTKLEAAEEKAETVVGAKEVTKYTVTFKDYDGTVLKTEEVEEGKSATAPADPTREGYVFTGWDKEFANVTGDMEVTAVYEEEKAPVDPGKDDPADPGKDDPADPGKDDPVDPGKDDPAKPDDGNNEPTTPDDENNKPANPDENNKPADENKPAEENKETPDGQFDQTGVSIAVAGIISLIVIAGAVVLIKRK